MVGEGKLDLIYLVTILSKKIDGAVNNPASVTVLTGALVKLYLMLHKMLMFTSRPKFKNIIGVN
jgi:iron complex outermembrane receptor protein